MSSDGGITFKDVVIAVDTLMQQNKAVSIAAIRRVIGRGNPEKIKMLWRLLGDPAVNRVSMAETSDRLIAKMLSENLTKNEGVQGHLVEVLDTINELQERMNDTFAQVNRALLLAQTVIMVNLNDIGEISDLQNRLRKEIADLKYILENNEGK